jgi:hypothetical protein
MFWLGLLIIICSALLGVTTAAFAGLNVAAIMRGNNESPKSVYHKHFVAMIALFISVLLGLTGIAVLITSLLI